ncbi:hypothetical protein E1B28_010442 [Marasmius oreades]|uniref:Uncharacterized protein n=1 Tax=Marasmius oreades TaxID=181124 RepID=A0A9P7RXS7_9AGAR|nr:uncharacterized protein E1B28_010442 [Marasmius oreades]KAG7091405.1 hypothetical protein E1B28_010442 [Marasmius oreades]
MNIWYVTEPFEVACVQVLDSPTSDDEEDNDVPNGDGPGSDDDGDDGDDNGVGPGGPGGFGAGAGGAHLKGRPCLSLLITTISIVSAFKKSLWLIINDLQGRSGTGPASDADVRFGPVHPPLFPNPEPEPPTKSPNLD